MFEEWPKFLPDAVAHRQTIGSWGFPLVAPDESVSSTIVNDQSFLQGFLNDTGLAGRIASGPLVGTTEGRSGTGSNTETRPLVGVDVDLCPNDQWRTVTAGIVDRSAMTYPALLGRDILETYTLDIGRTVEE
jgi:hypothetical protein